MSRFLTIAMGLTLSGSAFLRGQVQEPVIEAAIIDGTISAQVEVSAVVQQGIFEERINWTMELKRCQSDEIIKPVAKVAGLTLAEFRQRLNLVADFEQGKISIKINEMNLENSQLYAHMIAMEYMLLRINLEGERLRRKTQIKVDMKLLELELLQASHELRRLRKSRLSGEDFSDPALIAKEDAQEEVTTRLRGERGKLNLEMEKFQHAHQMRR